jgi:plastocyanin
MKKVIVIVVVLVLLIGGGIFLKSRNNSSQNNAATSTAANTTVEDMSDMAGQDGSTNSSSPSGEAIETDRVDIQDFAFGPVNIKVKKGTTVTWTNQDSTVHTVTETDGQDGPKSKNLTKGQSYAFTYKTLGTFKYDCSIHPNMTGSVTVTE